MDHWFYPAGHFLRSHVLSQLKDLFRNLWVGSHRGSLDGGGVIPLCYSRPPILPSSCCCGAPCSLGAPWRPFWNATGQEGRTWESYVVLMLILLSADIFLVSKPLISKCLKEDPLEDYNSLFSKSLLTATVDKSGKAYSVPTTLISLRALWERWGKNASACVILQPPSPPLFLTPSTSD